MFFSWVYFLPPFLKIKDIYSYVRYYNLGIVAQYNEVDIQKAFNERYGNKYYIVKKEEKKGKDVWRKWDE